MIKCDGDGWIDDGIYCETCNDSHVYECTGCDKCLPRTAVEELIDEYL
jgi:hypothetical protein